MTSLSGIFCAPNDAGTNNRVYIVFSSAKYDGLTSLKSNLLCAALCDNGDNRFKRSTSGASLVNSNEALFLDHINSHRQLWSTWRFTVKDVLKGNEIERKRLKTTMNGTIKFLIPFYSLC